MNEVIEQIVTANVKNAIELIQSVEDLDVLAEALNAEAKAKNRISVVKAIEKRIDELSSPADQPNQHDEHLDEDEPAVERPRRVVLRLVRDAALGDGTRKRRTAIAEVEACGKPDELINLLLAGEIDDAWCAGITAIERKTLSINPHLIEVVPAEQAD